MGAMKGQQKNQRLATPSAPRTLKEIREGMGLTQPELARLMGLSTRWVAAQEAAPVNPTADRRVAEVVRLLDSLTQVVQPAAIRGWLATPNPAFGGLKPIEVVERGEIDRLWQMIYYMESGVAS
jgi:transcriptional regulator with XRE-family HTH domain